MLAERRILEVLLNRPDLFDHAAEQLDSKDFIHEQYRKVAECLWSAGANGRINLEDLLATEEMADLGAVLADLVQKGERRGNYEPTLNGAVEHILYQRDRESLKQLRTAGHDDDTLHQLHNRLKTSDMRKYPKTR